MSFTNYTYFHKVPFTSYADTVPLIVPFQSCTSGNDMTIAHSSPDHRKVLTTALEPMKILSGFCYTIVDHEGILYKFPVVYRRDGDLIGKFLSENYGN